MASKLAIGVTQHCPRCGAAVGQGSRFCVSCGADLTTSPQSYPPPAPAYAPPPVPPKSNSKMLLIVIAVVAVVAIAAIAVAAMNMGPTSGSPGGDNSGVTSGKTLWDWSAESKDALSYELTPGYPSAVTPSDGNHWLVVNITVVNGRDVSIESNAYMWEFKSSGIEYTASSYTWFADVVDYESVTITNGGTASWQIVYEVPIGVTSGTMSYTGIYAFALERDDSLI